MLRKSRMWLRMPQRQGLSHTPQEGTFVMVLISGEAWPAVFTGGVVHVIGSMASPTLVPPASSTLPVPNFCRGCSKELTITPWRLQKFEKHGHWPARCYVCNAKRAAASQLSILWLCITRCRNGGH